jgi:hypothetical protein
MPGGGATHDGARQCQPNRPAEEQTAVQPPGQRDRAAQGGGCRGGAGSLREQAGADVPATGQHVPDRDEDCRDPDEQRGHPPPFTGVRAHVQRPAGWRQPAQPGRSGIADGAQQVGPAEDGTGDADGGPGAIGELRRRGRDCGEQHPDKAGREAKCHRTGDRQPGRHQSERNEDRDGHVRQRCDKQRGGEWRVTPDHGGADELQPAGFLLGPGMPHDRQQAHQPDQDELGHADLPHSEPADRHAEQRPAQGDERRVAEDTAHRAEILLGRVELEIVGRGPHRHHREPEHPHGQPDPVEPQRQPHQGAGAGQRVHRATSARCFPSARVPS